ncbi:N-acetylmuramoyl-L-alanine amidase [Bacillaceae bacterium CLA-AA-H227]|uniref:N-acetylmuramoyl-L-alanine amidase n=1 Tax=Robertmurraya yapensis (ex Hitch et al 2024) TaxID=3133160 RepID=A0ACC6SFR6_9BACI
MKILIDAGHGYNTPGKRSPDGMREYEFNRVVASYAKSLLEKFDDVTVYFSHSDTKDVSLQERTNKANHLDVDCFVSIHANAYGTGWNNVSGIETYVYTTKPTVATALAEKVQKNLIVATGRTDRGVKTGTFHVLKATAMPAIIVECGFMTNKEEVQLLRSDVYRRTCAEAIVKGIKSQFKLKDKLEMTYTVLAGPFPEKTTASELVERLKKDGYQATIISE